jgi:hypothetical protein
MSPRNNWAWSEHMTLYYYYHQSFLGPFIGKSPKESLFGNTNYLKKKIKKKIKKKRRKKRKKWIETSSNSITKNDICHLNMYF